MSLVLVTQRKFSRLWDMRKNSVEPDTLQVTIRRTRLTRIEYLLSGNKWVLQFEKSSTDTINNTTEKPNRFNLQTAQLPTQRQQKNNHLSTTTYTTAVEKNQLSTTTYTMAAEKNQLSTTTYTTAAEKNQLSTTTYTTAAEKNQLSKITYTTAAEKNQLSTTTYTTAAEKKINLAHPRQE